MCGLAGFLLSQPSQHSDELAARASSMAHALAHRGPDDAGVWVDATAGIALAHRRLSIVDLSTAGHQPMLSSDGRFVLSYNGEIYNAVALGTELAALGHAFRGHSDTEVLLAAISAWGLEPGLARCNGMFALALWDREERCLWLARDRIGKKPLYYGWAGDTLVFGSELKALWQHSAFDNSVDRNALGLLLRLDYIPAPHCIHERTFKLMPGRILRMDASSVANGAAAHVPHSAQQPFWDARQRMRARLATPHPGAIEEAEHELDQRLHAAITKRMVADVPVGVLLSGGTDSSVVAAIMQAESTTPVRSFSIGFEGSHHDEAPLARAVACHLGTDHTELYVNGADALAVVPTLPTMFDEPFADASQVPTVLVARLARGRVTVALSGDGGDELFFGYRRYQRALRNWRMLARVPLALRRFLAGRPTGELARLGGIAALRAELGARGIGDVYRRRISRWRDPVAVIHGASGAHCHYDAADPLAGAGTPADAMMLADTSSYLPDDLLCKVDRTTMAVSLEARAPLLDWELVEWVWSLPLAMKYSPHGETKYLLKRVLRRYLPEAMVQRPKRGFGAPVGHWLRTDLRDWADALLDRTRLRAEAYFEPAPILAIWEHFQRGERKWHTHLWNVVMFQAWLEGWRAKRQEVTAGSR